MLLKDLEQKLNASEITDEDVREVYKIYQSYFNIYKCNTDLIEAFGLTGIKNEYARYNPNPLYCPNNRYTCCTAGQIRSSQNIFGKSLVNLRKNIEPIIELASSFKTEKFIFFLASNSSNKICKNIILQALNFDFTSSNFKMKNFLKYLFKYKLLIKKELWIK